MADEKRTTEIIVNGKKAEASIKDIEAAVKVLNNQVRKLPKNTQDFADKRKELQEMRKTLKGVKDDVYKIPDATQKASKGFDQVKVAIKAAFTATVILEAINKVVEFGKMLLETESKVTKLKGSIQQLTGVTEEELDKATVKAQALGNTFGDEAQDIVKSANDMAKAMDISLIDALGQLEQGYLAGANAGGDFLAQVSEYSTQFKAAGASAGELVAIIAKSNKEGIFSDKGADTVKEFGLRIREQTKTTSEALEAAFGKEFTTKLFQGINDGSVSTVDALKQVSAQMNNAQIPANQLQTVIADVFGGPGEDAGLAFLQSLKDIDGEVSNLIDTNSEYIQMQQTQLQLEEELAEAQGMFAESIEGSSSGIGNLMTILQTFLYKGLAVAVNFIRQDVVPVMESIGKAVYDFLEPALTIVGEYISNVLVPIMKVWFALLEPIATLIWELGKTYFTSLVIGFQMLGDTLGKFLPDFGAASDGMQTFADNINNKVLPALAGVTAGIGQFGELVRTFLKNLTSGNFSDAFDVDISSIGKAYEEGVKDYKQRGAQIAAEEDQKAAEEEQARIDEQEKAKRQQRIIHQRKSAEELAKAREEARKKELAAARALEDLKIQLIENTTQREIEKTKLDTQRKIEALVGSEEQITEQKLLLEQLRDQRLEELKLQLEEEKKAKQEEEDALKAEELALKEEEEKLVLEEKFYNALATEEQHEMAMFDLKKKYLQERLKLLTDSGKAESIEAQRINNELLKLEKEKSDKSIENEKRTKAMKDGMQKDSFDLAKNMLGLGIELLGQDEEARKKHGQAIKAFSTAQTLIRGYEEVQAIWANSAQFGPFGYAMAITQTAAAALRTAGAIKNINAKQFYDGGVTVLDQGQRKRAANIGSFAGGGHIDSTSIGVIGERGPEWVAPNWMLNTPTYANIIGQLEQARVRGFAEGGATTTAPPSTVAVAQSGNQTANQVDTFNVMMERLDMLIMAVGTWQANLQVNNNLQEVRDGLQVLNDIQSDAEIQ
ncbi:phage tail tape measure protein [Limibacter armeniacum]|uniref:phage tail tape measure protein n=1 Tax=Limibacter armeniacum TaxID=466084 RepID=UPI002FE5B929